MNKDHCKPKPICQCLTRNCMKCGFPFVSTGNRTCPVCQRSNRRVSVLGGKIKPITHRGKAGAE